MIFTHIPEGLPPAAHQEYPPLTLLPMRLAGDRPGLCEAPQLKHSNPCTVIKTITLCRRGARLFGSCPFSRTLNYFTHLKRRSIIWTFFFSIPTDRLPCPRLGGGPSWSRERDAGCAFPAHGYPRDRHKHYSGL